MTGQREADGRASAGIRDLNGRAATDAQDAEIAAAPDDAAQGLRMDEVVAVVTTRRVCLNGFMTVPIAERKRSAVR